MQYTFMASVDADTEEQAWDKFEANMSSDVRIVSTWTEQEGYGFTEDTRFLIYVAKECLTDGRNTSHDYSLTLVPKGDT